MIWSEEYWTRGWGTRGWILLCGNGNTGLQIFLLVCGACACVSALALAKGLLDPVSVIHSALSTFDSSLPVMGKGATGWIDRGWNGMRNYPSSHEVVQDDFCAVFS